MPLPRSLSTAVNSWLVLGQALVVAVVPHGGQRTSRRNAWASMAEDAARGRARRDAAVAIRAAELHAEVASGLVVRG